MKVYLLQPLVRNGDYAYESLWPVDDAGWPDFWRFDCIAKGQNWDATQAIVAPSEVGEPVGDFPYLTHGCLVLSTKALSSLRHLLELCCELLPLQCIDGRSFALCNPCPCYDFLDQENTRGKRFSDGKRWMRIERFAFRRNAVPTSAVFKLADDTRRVFCSSAFKTAVEQAGLVGLRFREVWNDDGDPVETIDFLDFLK